MKILFKTIYPFLWIAALLILAFGVVANCKRTPEHHILVIHSFQPLQPNYPEFNRLLESEFSKQGEPSTFTYFYLDAENLDHNEEVSAISELLEQQNLHNKPDLIIVTGDQATYSLMQGRNKQSKSIPTVFLGVQFPNEQLLKTHPNITGLVDSIDVLENMKVAKELTDKRHTFTVLERGTLDRKMRQLCHKQLDSVPYVIDNLEWKHTLFHIRYTPDSLLTLTSLSLDNMSRNTHESEDQERLGNTNFNYLVRLDNSFLYLQLKMDAVSQTVLSMANKEQITATYHYFNTKEAKIIGGYFAPIDLMVKDGVAMAVRILQGEKPSDIPLGVCRKEYFVDWTIYQRYKRDIHSIPEKYHVVGASFSNYYPRLSKAIYSLSFICGVGLIVFFVVLFVRERKHKKALTEKYMSERKLLKSALQNSQSFAWHQIKHSINFEEAFWKYIDKAPQEITTDDFLRFVHPESKEEYKSALTSLLKGKESVIEIRCDFKGSGKYEWWQVRANQLQATHKVTESYGLVLNIESFKQREEELVKARKMAEQAELKESFLANMSHEIRTPLNAIVGFSNILATPGMDLSEEEKLEFMNTINKNNDLLLKLINDILDISRIESGHILMQMTHHSVSQLMDYIYQSFSVQVPAHLNFIYEKGPDELYIESDEGRVEQIMTNFLQNAAKFTSEGYIKMGWQCLNEGKEVALYVEDSGIGMSEEQQILAFDRFYKADEFKQGTGLGLSICKVIAEKLHGRIDVTSSEGKGSRFALILPLTQI